MYISLQLFSLCVVAQPCKQYLQSMTGVLSIIHLLEEHLRFIYILPECGSTECRHGAEMSKRGQIKSTYQLPV